MLCFENASHILESTEREVSQRCTSPSSHIEGWSCTKLNRNSLSKIGEMASYLTTQRMYLAHDSERLGSAFDRGLGIRC
jgi:hypothetical protein